MLEAAGNHPCSVAFFRRDAVDLPPPDYGKTPELWWACMVFMRLLHMELVLSCQQSTK